MTREKRVELILEFLATIVWPLTMREVGQGVGLRKTPYLKSLLDSMVSDGTVLTEWVREPRGYTQYFWINREG
jgi:hypothetical protein